MRFFYPCQPERNPHNHIRKEGTMYDRVEARQAKMSGKREPWRMKLWQVLLGVGVTVGLLLILYFSF
jgi:hypothetical protein